MLNVSNSLLYFTANIGVLDNILKPMPKPTPEQVFLFENLCKKLRLKFHGVKMFSDPVLQSFYTNLEAAVYDEEAEDVDDLTSPNIPMQDEKVAPFLSQIEEEFGSVSLKMNVLK